MRQLLVAAGALLGLVTVDGPGDGGSAWAAVEPYVTHALVGAALGLVVVILLHRLRPGVRVAATPGRQAIPERVRHEVWRRDRGTCVECGSRGRLEFDHIIPVSRGGANTARNIELRCEPCNRRKGARI
jgi:HNH endonuclease